LEAMQFTKQHNILFYTSGDNKSSVFKCLSFLGLNVKQNPTGER